MRAFVVFSRAKMWATDARGVSAIEFALLCPLFFGLLFGVFTFGVHLSASNSVAQLCSDIARATVAGVDETERRAIAETYLDHNLGQYAFLHADHITLEVSDSKTEPFQFDVHIEYDASELPAAVWTNLVDRPAPTIVSTATVRHGGF